MTDEDLAKTVSAEFSQAMNQPNGDIANLRTLAWKRYMRELLGNEEEGESEAMTSDVSEIVDGLMPGLMSIFANADNLCMFQPVGKEDVAGAQQETDYVNYVFWREQKNSFLEMFCWFFDAMLGKNGIAMAWWESSEEICEEEYTGLTVDEIDKEIAKAKADGATLEPVLRSEPYEKEVPNPLSPTEMVKAEVFDVTFRRVETVEGVRWECVPLEEFRISSDANKPQTDSARMRGRERAVSRDFLVKFGFDKDQVYSLEAHGKNKAATTHEQAAKRSTSDERGGTGSPSSKDDKSQEEVLFQEAYIRADYDGDGRAELRQVFLGGGKLLKWNEKNGGGMANRIVHRDPFHVAVAKPLPHKFWAKAPAEDEIGTMEITTTLLRQTLMNLYHTNNPGEGVNEYMMSENTMDDLLSAKVGRKVRFAGDPNQAHKTLGVEFMARDSFSMLAYFDQKKKDRHGVSSDAESLSPEMMKNIQKGVMASMMEISTEKRVLMAHFFAESGIKSLMLHIHELLLRHRDKKKVVQLRNQWVEVDPSEWRHRYNMVLGVGLGIGTREQQQMFLQGITDLQEKIMSDPGLRNLIVTPKNVYNTAVELSRLAKIPDPSLHFTDPGEQLAPPPSSEQEELQRQQQELQARQQQLDAERQQNQARKFELDRQEQELRHQRESAKLEEAAQKRLDQFSLENERLRNDLAKMELKRIDDEEKRGIEKAKTDAEVERIRANAQQMRAQALEALQRTRKLDIENDALIAGLLESPESEEPELDNDDETEEGGAE